MVTMATENERTDDVEEEIGSFAAYVTYLTLIAGGLILGSLLPFLVT